MRKEFPDSTRVEKNMSPITLELEYVSETGDVKILFSEKLRPLSEVFNILSDRRQLSTGSHEGPSRRYNKYSPLELLNRYKEDVFEVSYATFVTNDIGEEERIPVLHHWYIGSFNELNMTMKFNFTNPLYVSSQERKDELQIRVKEHVLFRSKSGNSMMARDYAMKAIAIPQ